MANTENREKTAEIIEFGLGSEDLFCSQKSKNSTSTNASKKRQIEDYTWVQCDNLECQKWRKIPVDDAEGLDDVDWFCHMNTDPVHNTCESVEEDYQAYDRLAKRLGYKYVMSHLTEGTVVWAKMTGYCRWPAIISKDPSCDLYYMVDNEGHPSRYHVEYLGKQHSHAWIPSKLIDLYGHRAEKDNYTQKQYNKKDSKGNSKKKGKKKKRVCLKAELGYKKLSVYKRSPVEAAVEEAESLLPLSPRKRLMKCTFQPTCISNNTPISKKNCPAPERNTNKTYINRVSFTLEKGKTRPESSGTSGGDIVYCYMNQHYARNTGQNCQGQKKIENTVPLKLCKKDPTVFEFKDCKLTPNKFENKICKSGKITNLEIQKTVEKPEVCSEFTKFECSKLDMKNTLMNKSKEERFKIDIEMYKRNEKAFDHDLFRFMERNQMKLKKKPVWHNTPIGLFQLFLAVYERGGYQQVSTDWKWTAVYRELTNMGHGSAGHTAKSFYGRHLYPYELFVKGENYHDVLEKIRSGKKVSGYVKNITKQKEVEKQTESVKQEEVEQYDDLDYVLSPSQESAELELMLQELDKSNNIFKLEEEVEAAQRRLGISMRYHEESSKHNLSPGIATNASEPGLADLPEESAQIVPDVMFSSSDGSTENADLLLELQALENEFDSFDNQLVHLAH